jgi:hypothetical protein
LAYLSIYRRIILTDVKVFVDWIHLVQDTDQSWALVNTMMNLEVT